MKLILLYLLYIPRDEGHAPQVEKESHWLPRLKPHLSLPIPVPLAKGNPDENYPFYWSINKWVEGDTSTHDNVSDKKEFALDLAGILKELQSIDTTGGPPGGEHNYYRGCPLTEFTFHEWTITGLDLLGDVVDRDRCLYNWALWKALTITMWNPKESDKVRDTMKVINTLAKENHR